MLRHYEREARNQSRDAVINQIADIKPDASSRRSPYFSEEHEMLRAQVRRFVETRSSRTAIAWEEQGFVPREVLRRMGELGLSRHSLSGANLAARRWTRSATVVLAEELGRSHVRRLVAITVARPYRHGLGAPRQCRQPAQKAMDARKSSPASAITAVAVTEPDAGSDVKGIRTTARRDGDGYVLNGAKMFITNGVHADLYSLPPRPTPGRARQAADLHVPGRKGNARVSVSPRARQARLALVRHRRTAFRELPHAGANCSARKAAASTRSCATFRTSAW